MHAVIRTGSKQYRVAEGDTIKVEKIEGNAGDLVRFHDVLLVSDGDKVQVGNPVVEGATVEGTIRAQDKHKKVISFRFRRRKDSKRIRGHRQMFTEVQIDSIKA